jgi:predicted P-loop ATPase
VFVASTNDTAYLRDSTGNRRFWPVKIGVIDLEYLRADRDQLFAEALVAIRSGEQYWPDRKFEAKHIRPEQETRYAVDEWECLIKDWLYGKTTATVPNIASLALGIEAAKLGTTEQRRITIALQRLKWGPNRDKDGRWWEPIPLDHRIVVDGDNSW